MTTLYLSEEERDFIISTLNNGQKAFLTKFLKREKKNTFTKVMEKEQSSTSDHAEEVAKHWELVDFIDAGSDWETLSQLFCECGEKLRYQYILKNNITNEVKQVGLNHLEKHTGMPKYLAHDIRKAFVKVNYELDEILQKIKNGWDYSDAGLDQLPLEAEIPSDIKEHLNYGLPLLKRQVSKIKMIIAKERWFNRRND